MKGNLDCDNSAGVAMARAGRPLRDAGPWRMLAAGTDR
jgi:hypothetical protein